ncbi:aspartyl-phosphate phosphatase Spo0E family protein [Metabacillus lacus]|uniref:aspartyl-phosphate phosphatase Spo0E family protein n=1 Tax=Metabacillus lacus TaxID=1983721 RepID=UPI0031B5C2A6
MSNSKQELIKRIECKRAQLIETVGKNGLSSSITIQYSQELDCLINEYQTSFNTSKLFTVAGSLSS